MEHSTPEPEPETSPEPETTPEPHPEDNKIMCREGETIDISVCWFAINKFLIHISLG